MNSEDSFEQDPNNLEQTIDFVIGGSLVDEDSVLDEEGDSLGVSDDSEEDPIIQHAQQDSNIEFIFQRNTAANNQTTSAYDRIVLAVMKANKVGGISEKVFYVLSNMVNNLSNLMELINTFKNDIASLVSLPSSFETIKNHYKKIANRFDVQKPLKIVPQVVDGEETAQPYPLFS